MFNTIFEIRIFVIFIAAFALVFVDNLRTRVTNAKLNKDVTQGLLDLMALKKKLDESYNNNDSKKLEETEGFLKFVSQSRDWAFQYIERVQITIKEFQDIFHPVAVQYYKDKNKPIDQETFGKLVEAYKKLIDELPEEGKKDV